jgi:hypothetical protein
MPVRANPPQDAAVKLWVNHPKVDVAWRVISGRQVLSATGRVDIGCLVSVDVSSPEFVKHTPSVYLALALPWMRILVGGTPPSEWRPPYAPLMVVVVRCDDGRF